MMTTNRTMGLHEAVILDTHILIWLMRCVPPSWQRPNARFLNRPRSKARNSLHAIGSCRSVGTADQVEKERSSGNRRKDEDRLDPQDALRCSVDLLAISGICATRPVSDLHRTVLDPSLNHKDPFDEMLLVHAQRLGARLLTRDGRLAHHPVALVA